eukprot:snap_masked-scaffold_126-processed-gene-0.7-mRNA-1 protein AED:1.00 eAED:1.00 QI:0/0/0/0/1/1/2/0/632
MKIEKGYYIVVKGSFFSAVFDDKSKIKFGVELSPGYNTDTVFVPFTSQPRLDSVEHVFYAPISKYFSGILENFSIVAYYENASQWLSSISIDYVKLLVQPIITGVSGCSDYIDQISEDYSIRKTHNCPRVLSSRGNVYVEVIGSFFGENPIIRIAGSTCKFNSFLDNLRGANCSLPEAKLGEFSQYENVSVIVVNGMFEELQDVKHYLSYSVYPKVKVVKAEVDEVGAHYAKLNYDFKGTELETKSMDALLVAIKPFYVAMDTNLTLLSRLSYLEYVNAFGVQFLLYEKGTQLILTDLVDDTEYIIAIAPVNRQLHPSERADYVKSRCSVNYCKLKFTGNELVGNFITVIRFQTRVSDLAFSERNKLGEKNVVINGDATVDNRIVLTTDNVSLSSTVFFDRNVYTREGFEAEFSFSFLHPRRNCGYFGRRDLRCFYEGAEGIAFLLKTLNASCAEQLEGIIGKEGAGLGFDGLYNTLAIEIDNMRSENRGEYTFEHQIRVFSSNKDGEPGLNVSNQEEYTLATGSVSIEYAREHRVLVRYRPHIFDDLKFMYKYDLHKPESTFFHSRMINNQYLETTGLLEIYFNDYERPVISTWLNLEKFIQFPEELNQTCIGFSGSTGDINFQRQEIISL